MIGDLPTLIRRDPRRFVVLSARLVHFRVVRWVSIRVARPDGFQ